MPIRIRRTRTSAKIVKNRRRKRKCINVRIAITRRTRRVILNVTKKPILKKAKSRHPVAFRRLRRTSYRNSRPTRPITFWNVPNVSTRQRENTKWTYTCASITVNNYTNVIYVIISRLTNIIYRDIKKRTRSTIRTAVKLRKSKL